MVKVRTVRSTNARVVDPDAQAQDYSEVDPYDSDVEAVRPEGVFSTPARRMSLAVALLMLVAIGSAIVFLLSTRPQPQPQVVNNGPVSCAGIIANDLGEQAAPKTGSPAPNFELLDVRTNQCMKLSDLRGKPVFLNFWGTWCPPCRAEMPMMQTLHNKYQSEVVTLGVSMAPRDWPQGVEDFVNQSNYTWTFAHDTRQNVMLTYQVLAVPSSYFIDKNGVIRAIKVGAFPNVEEIESFLQQIRQ